MKTLTKLVCMFALSAASAGAAEKPNILVIWGDDIGYWNISAINQGMMGYPRAGSQTYPSPAAKENADGSTTIYFSPEQPEGVERGNWIETDPNKGWFTFLRLYFPEKPFFDKTWRPGEIELVK